MTIKFEMTKEQEQAIDKILAHMPMPPFDGENIIYPEGKVPATGELWIGLHADHPDSARFTGLVMGVCHTYMRHPEIRGALKGLMSMVSITTTGNEIDIDWSTKEKP